MATPRNKRKLAALNKKICEEHPRSNQGQNSSVPRSQEDYITQVFDETEEKVTMKLSQELSRTENCILGTFLRLDDFLMNPLIQGYSGTAAVTSQNASGTNQGTNEDDSQSDPQPDAGIFRSQTTQNSGTEFRHDMLTGVREGFTYCSPSTSPAKQEKNRSISQPQFRSQNTPTTIEEDQILLTFQQLANNNNSARVHKIINRSSKLIKSLTTAMRTFDRKSEKFELFEHFFQTSLKVHNHSRPRLFTNNSLMNSGEIRRGLKNRGHSNIRGCSGTVCMTTTPPTTFAFFFLSSGLMNDVAFELLHGGFTILFNKYQNYLVPRLTDLSASKDVHKIFPGYIQEEN